MPPLKVAIPASKYTEGLPYADKLSQPVAPTVAPPTPPPAPKTQPDTPPASPPSPPYAPIPAADAAAKKQLSQAVAPQATPSPAPAPAAAAPQPPASSTPTPQAVAPITAQAGSYQAQTAQTAQKYGLDPSLFVAQIGQESGYAEDVINGSRVSSAGAQGIAQLMPETAKALGVDPLNPAQALDGAARYMVSLRNLFGGDMKKAVAAYNAGPGTVQDAVDQYGGAWAQHLPQETQDYLGNVFGFKSTAVAASAKNVYTPPAEVYGPPTPIAGENDPRRSAVIHAYLALMPAEMRPGLQAVYERTLASGQSYANAYHDFIKALRASAAIVDANKVDTRQGQGLDLSRVPDLAEQYLGKTNGDLDKALKAIGSPNEQLSGGTLTSLVLSQLPLIGIGAGLEGPGLLASFLGKGTQTIGEYALGQGIGLAGSEAAIQAAHKAGVKGTVTDQLFGLAGGAIANHVIGPKPSEPISAINEEPPPLGEGETYNPTPQDILLGRDAAPPEAPPAKPLPGQAGLFGETVDTEGNIIPPEGVDTRPQMGSMQGEGFRGDQSGIQGGLLTPDENAATAGGSGYQPGLGEGNVAPEAKPADLGTTPPANAGADWQPPELAPGTQIVDRVTGDGIYADIAQLNGADRFSVVARDAETGSSLSDTVHQFRTQDEARAYAEQAVNGPAGSQAATPENGAAPPVDAGTPPTNATGTQPPQPGAANRPGDVVPLPAVNGIERDRRVIPVSDITTRPDLFQLRDVGSGQPFDERRVQSIVNGWNDRQFVPPTVVPDPENPGKWIVTAGHHRTEAYRRVKGPDAPIEVVAEHYDITDPAQLKSAQLEADASNFTTAAPNYREQVRTAQRSLDAGQTVEQTADAMRMTPGQVDRLIDASRLGQQAVDRVVTEPGLQPYAEEIGRGMRVYGVDEGDANGLFNRIASAKKGARPTPTAVRETMDQFGAALQQLRMEQDQGALFNVGQFEGMRGGILTLIDENMRIRTELARLLSSNRSEQNAVRRLADKEGATAADRRAADRLVKLAQQDESRLRALIKANEEDVARVIRGEPPKAEAAAAAANAPEPELPDVLAGAKPRYKGSQLEFESDLDKAAYIAAGATKSKRDAEFVQFVSDATGMNERQVRAYGRQVRSAIGNLTEEDGTVYVPKQERGPPLGGEPPEGAVPPDPPAPIGNDPVDQLIANVRAAGAARPDLLAARRQELATRVARAAQELERDGLSATDALTAARRQLRGQLADPSFDVPATLNMEGLRGRIVEAMASEDVRFFTGINAQDGLEKLGNGVIPAPHEVEALGQVFGPRLQQAIEDLGDVFKVQRRVEQVLTDRDQPFTITLPDGSPVTPDLLAEAMKARLPGVNEEQLGIATERIVASGKAKAYIRKDGSTGVTLGIGDNHDALGNAVRRATFEEPVPEQIIPPTSPSLGDKGYQRTAADVGGVTEGPGPTLEIPPWRDLEGPSLGQRRLARGLENDVSFDPNSLPPGTGDHPLPLEGQPTTPRMQNAGGEPSYQVPPWQDVEGLSADQNRVLRVASEQGLTVQQRSELLSIARGGAKQNDLLLKLHDYVKANMQADELAKFREHLASVEKARQKAAEGKAAPPLTREEKLAQSTLKYFSEDAPKENRLQTVAEYYRGLAELRRAAGVSGPFDSTLNPRAGSGDALPPRGNNAGAGDQYWLGKDWQPTVPLATKIWNTLGELPSLPKAWKATLDRSAYLRQGGLLIRHGKEVLDAVSKTMVIAEDAADAQRLADTLGKVGIHVDAGSIPNAEDVMRAVNNGKWAEVRRQAGLVIEEWGPGAKVELKNENFTSKLATLIPGAKMSERAFVVYLNKLRADVFDNIAEAWQREGRQFTQKDLTDLADYLNKATGHGDLGQFEGAARVLSKLWFAPRNVVSRYQVIEKLFDPRTSSLVRQEMAKDLAVYVGGGITLLSLAAMSGLAVVELDPRSPDFGKMHVGPTRIDLWGGYQQIARYTAQLITGQAKASTGTIYDTNRMDVIGRYLRNKLSPAGGLGVSILDDQNFQGGKFQLLSAQTATDLFAPLFLTDLVEAVKQDGLEGLAVAPLSFFGVSTQSYTTPGEALQQARDKVAEERFGSSYQDLIDKYPNKGFTYRAQVDEDPAVAERAAQAKEARTASSSGRQELAADQFKAQMDQRQAQAESDWKAGTLPKSLPEIWGDLTKERVGAREQQALDYDSHFNRSEFDKTLDGYYGQLVYRSGIPDWEETTLRQQAYLQSLPAKQRAQLEDFLGVQDLKKSPLYQQYQAYLNKREAAGYYKDGITQAERQQLDLKNPELDAEGWKWQGGVQGATPPTLQSTQAVDLALSMNLPNRPIKMAGLTRPVNENAQTLQAWDYSKKAIEAYQNQVVPKFQDQEAERLYGVTFDKLPEAKQNAVISNIKTTVRANTPELDAWLMWWGETDTLQSTAAAQYLKAILDKYGKTPPKANFQPRIAQNAQ